MNVLVLMAGPEKDFSDKGCPKYLVEVCGKPVIQRILETVENIANTIICIIRRTDQENYFLGDTLRILCPKCKVLESYGDTKGAVCSALFAIDEIDNTEELLVMDGTHLVKADIAAIIEEFRERRLDGGIVTIKAVSSKFSSILLDENGFVIQTSEKRPISNIASTGCCYFKQGSDFVRSAFSVIEKDANTQGCYYISSTFNEMILDGKKIGIHEIPAKDYLTFSEHQMHRGFAPHRRSDA